MSHFCSSRMSKDILSSTIATLSTITNNVNCCKQPFLLETNIDTASQNHDKSDQSEALTQPTVVQPANENRFLLHGYLKTLHVVLGFNCDIVL